MGAPANGSVVDGITSSAWRALAEISGRTAEELYDPLCFIDNQETDTQARSCPSASQLLEAAQCISQHCGFRLGFEECMCHLAKHILPSQIRCHLSHRKENRICPRQTVESQSICTVTALVKVQASHDLQLSKPSQAQCKQLLFLRAPKRFIRQMLIMSEVPCACCWWRRCGCSGMHRCAAYASRTEERSRSSGRTW